MPDPELGALEQILVRADVEHPDFAYRDVRRLPPATWNAILASQTSEDTDHVLTQNRAVTGAMGRNRHPG